jgi:uncharacterized alkaline shock family protein YloU
MSKNENNKKKEKLKLRVNDSTVGEVKIASNVIAIIAVHAAREIDGVVGTYGGLTDEIKGYIGMKKGSKGIKVNFDGGKLQVSALITVRYGKSIPEISKSVQDRIKEKVEYMTGLTVDKVNVRIAGVSYEEVLS